ncbi:retropepsin-like aspartic protease [Galbibacter sp.]|uniref:retropepsin-like aspartic protease n=1 Tax=Galbibacter sp. TaxID=2918471 RepID=UPI002C19B69A|nr:retropepsin-like aspartic protease [Galbibacter sp.]HLV62153.1 retropepsin-like aspartic protease [Galbibacter sp.]
MKNIIWILFIIASGCNTTDKIGDISKETESLHQLIEKLDYFRLKKEFSSCKNTLPKTDALYFEAILENAFNRPKQSNQLIDEFFKNSLENDSLGIKLLQIKLNNYIHLSEYAKAKEVNEILRQKYVPYMDSVALEDLNNTYKIWDALKDVPPQEIIKKMDVSLPIQKDKAGLSTITTNFGNATMNFVFDTGANFSVIQRSVAQGLGMKIIPANFNVEAITGLEVKSDLAVAEKLELGTITLKNIVFLVFDDAALSFPSIDYEIKGIIGFPVIRALEEIQIKMNGQLIVPKSPTQYNLNNFALNEYVPIVKTIYKGDELRFSFDTGAQQTALFSSFFKKYNQEIKSKYKKVTLKTGGAGGHSQMKGYVINNFKLSIGDSQATLDSVQLYPDKIGNVDRMDGNLGQDFIQQFDTMVISFKYTSLLFR